MTTVARVHIEHPDLALTPTIRAMPEGTIRVVSRTGTDPEHATFPFLVTCRNWGPSSPRSNATGRSRRSTAWPPRGTVGSTRSATRTRRSS
ncbi:hypothetical protein ACFQH6_12625 [Halobacteriaceae archaeon GCM10025711]